ncbi:hypothetical protein DUI87_05476 [Hirundo rustica rustica]|uniref:Uncharacterized protein n=1 Tax=Hirundo rustica rustica TaxID=333673 RepID=A0A3M0KWY0_HIRRU|nr:hypothetical protein DUI87_05476 [Hirundo rustica rustica]
MSNSCGSPEDAGKHRGRDGKIRREDVDDSQPEGKRLKLGNAGGSSGKDREAAEDAIMPCSGREEPVPEGGGEGKSNTIKFCDPGQRQLFAFGSGKKGDDNSLEVSGGIDTRVTGILLLVEITNALKSSRVQKKTFVIYVELEEI